MSYKPIYTKYYKAREEKARRAVRSYNMKVTMLERAYGLINAPPRRTVKQLMEVTSNMRELNKELKEMSKIPKPSEAKMIKKNGVDILEFTLKEVERLNVIRNEKRLERKEKYGDTTKKSGYASSQEKSRQTPIDVKVRNKQQFIKFKERLQNELNREDDTEGYKFNYLQIIKTNYGNKVFKDIKEKLKDISEEEFYQMALSDDYSNNLFNIDVIGYSLEDPNELINEVYEMLDYVV